MVNLKYCFLFNFRSLFLYNKGIPDKWSRNEFLNPLSNNFVFFASRTHRLIQSGQINCCWTSPVQSFLVWDPTATRDHTLFFSVFYVFWNGASFSKRGSLTITGHYSSTGEWLRLFQSHSLSSSQSSYKIWNTAVLWITTCRLTKFRTKDPIKLTPVRLNLLIFGRTSQNSNFGFTSKFGNDYSSPSLLYRDWSAT